MGGARVHGIKIAAMKRSLTVESMQNGGQPMPEKQQSGKSAADTAPTRSGNKEPQGGQDREDVEEGVTSKDASTVTPTEPIDPKSPKLVTP
jgi:hypothetical protein